jgi:3-oxoacyl-[acyl-carrier-protein] synthase-3
LHAHSICWLAATSYVLPRRTEPAEEIDAKLHRPRGWLQRHAGILKRHVWLGEEALEAAGAAVRSCLEQAGAHLSEVGALLVASEAPALLLGQAAALHHHLGVAPSVIAVEVGGACTGFLMAIGLARALLARAGLVLVVALEAPTRYFRIEPGQAGEAAALFGDAAAASLLSVNRLGRSSTPLGDVRLWADGAETRLIQVVHDPGVGLAIQMQGITLAGKAIRVLAASVEGIAQDHGLHPAGLAAIVAHGGNGRMPEMLSRALAVPAERVWSETSQTGNLGSASLPVAWAARGPIAGAPVAWTAVGAGLTWGVMLSGFPQSAVSLPPATTREQCVPG